MASAAGNRRLGAGLLALVRLLPAVSVVGTAAELYELQAQGYR